MSRGKRLQQERLRLEMPQPELAELCGVSFRTQVSYEADKSAPDWDYLGKFAEIGGDPLYVVTGMRTDGNARQRVELDQLIKQLSSKERELLELFRATDDDGKKALLQMAKALSKIK